MDETRPQPKGSNNQEEKASLLARLKSPSVLAMLMFLGAVLGCLIMGSAVEEGAVVLGIAWGNGFDMEFPINWSRPVGSDINEAVRWTTREGEWLFDNMAYSIIMLIVYIKKGLTWVPWPAAILGISLLSYRMLGYKFGIFTLISLLLLAAFGMWEKAMETLAMIGTSVIISVAIALPIGIMAARNNLLDKILQPILDMMQTMPSFVYLVPAIMFFSLGNVPAVIATVVYAVPPAIRLTNLGIRQVDPEVVEAARSFGATNFQVLMKVQIPMAIPTIMAGINQTIMMALAMVVIAALVGAGGVGEVVWRGLGRQRPGDALIGGVGIVIMAVLIDRLTQALAKSRQEAQKGSRL